VQVTAAPGTLVTTTIPASTTTTAPTLTSPAPTTTSTTRPVTSSRVSRPVVTADPTDLVVSAGAFAVFTAAATGVGPLKMQWQVLRAGHEGFTDIAGADRTTLRFVASLSDNGNRYRAVFVSPSGGSAASTAASLTVRPARLALLELTGSVSYLNKGPVIAGSLDVSPPRGTIRSVEGTLTLPGLKGGAAIVRAEVVNEHGLSVGSIVIVDQSAGLDVTASIDTNSLARTASGGLAGHATGYVDGHPYRVEFTV
jgi:hypothetical protein